jgi:dimethylhistidine N-methyltransferase
MISMDAARSFHEGCDLAELSRFYHAVRQSSEALAAPLSDADATVQSMPDASPAKWHLAHTTWFFESMVLVPYLSGYRIFDDHFNFLFNSYYETIGARHPRPRRGLLTRPTLESIVTYRQYVDTCIEQLLRQTSSERVAQLIELGCHHEQQHQELLLTDILHLFAHNPLKPIYKLPEPLLVATQALAAPVYLPFEGGLVEIGHEGRGFAFDCEGPRHSVFIEPYWLAARPVTNREWIEFMADGGYRNPLLWLAEGWATLNDQHWTMPLYWEGRDDAYWTMTLRGPQPLDLDAPVTHVSYFEADAYATWSDRRLPTEAEWENAAAAVSATGNFADSGHLRPRPAGAAVNGGAHQLFGDVWEWTRSAFLPYPRFRPVAGAVGEYNGKFMSGQFVLRGGSCVTPPGHIRASYRNFFPPATRWQFAGVRLADDVEPRPSINSRPHRRAESFRRDVLSGLAQSPRRISSRWLYDDYGSRLFEEITRLEEYYPTRTETEILRVFSSEIAKFCGENLTVLEYGAGAALKTELLIEALHCPRCYVPIDIADDFLQHTAARFRRQFPTLTVCPITADFTSNFAIPDWIPDKRRVAFFPGSTIGNLDGDEVAAFLQRIRGHVGAGGRSLIGMDLCKALPILVPAYDDAAGVTARFNLNLLTRINRELAGNFALELFQHNIRWNESEAAIEMHLLSIMDQTVTVSGRTFELSVGESIHTESSRKYDITDFTNLAERHGWRVDRVWTDDKRLFGVFGMTAVPDENWYQGWAGQPSLHSTG